MYINMSRAVTISYKELQKEAKQRGIPANMKRTFLESAIEAFVDNDRDKLNSIVQHHKSIRKRRCNKSAKPSYTATSSARRDARNVADIGVVSTPATVQLASLSDSSQECINQRNGDHSVDDDLSDFHPDSTSTPNRSSSAENPNHRANDYSGGQPYRYVGPGPGPESGPNGVRQPYEISGFVTSCIPPSSVSLAKNNGHQEMLSETESKNETSLIYEADRYIGSSILKQTLAPTATHHQHHQHQYQHQHHQSYVANFNFVQRNCCSIQTVCSNTSSTIADTTGKDDADFVALGATATATYHRRPSFGYSSFLHRLPNNNSYYAYQTNDNTTSNFSNGDSHNFRPFADNFAVASASVDLAQTFNTAPAVGRNMADAASVNAEFDSDSDAETLSLTEEIVNLINSRTENTVPPLPLPLASSDAVLFLAASNTDASSSIFENQNRSANNNGYGYGYVGCDYRRYDHDYDYDYDNEERNTRGRPTTDHVLPLPQPVARSQSSKITTLDERRGEGEGEFDLLLPSISTLLPEYKIQAYRESSPHCYKSTPSTGARARGHCSQPQVDSDTRTMAAPWPSGSTLESSASYAYANANATTISEWSVPCKATIEPTNVNSYSYSYSRPYAESHSGETCFTDESSSSSIMGNFSETPMDVYAAAAAASSSTRTSKTNAAAAAAKPAAATCEGWSSLEHRCGSHLRNETLAVRGSSSTIDIGAKLDINRCTSESLQIKMNNSIVGQCEIQPVDDDWPIISYRSCKNKAQGCNAITNSRESARVHEQECFFQVVQCPADECNWCSVLSALTDHIYVCHRSDLNIGNDLVFVLDRNERDAPFTTFFQLYEGTIFVISMHVSEKKCIATMQYLPEIETADYKNKCHKGTMQLVYFSDQVRTKCWKGIVRPYFENDKTLYEKANILQSSIGNSKNIIIRVLIDRAIEEIKQPHQVSNT